MRRLSRFRPLLAAAQVTLHVLVRRLRAVVQAGAARLTAWQRLLRGGAGAARGSAGSCGVRRFWAQRPWSPGGKGSFAPRGRITSHALVGVGQLSRLHSAACSHGDGRQDEPSDPIRPVCRGSGTAMRCYSYRATGTYCTPRLKNGGIHVVLVVVFSRPGATWHFPKGSGACVRLTKPSPS
jgi:hypothetical protein